MVATLAIQFTHSISSRLQNRHFSMKKLFILTSLIALGTGQLTNAQGLVDGFLRGKGRTSMALSYSHESYGTYFVNTTETKNPNLGTITTNSVSLFAAYGLTKTIDLVASLPYVEAAASAGYWQTQKSLQDISVAVKWQAVKLNLGPVEVAGLLSAGYSLPVQNYVIDAPIAIGHGSHNFDGRAILHLKAGPFFVTGQYGYILRSAVTLDRVANYYAPDQVNPNAGQRVNVPDVTEGIVRAGLALSAFYVDGFIQNQTAYEGRGTNIGPGVPFPTNGIGFTRAGANLFIPIPGVKGLGVTGNFSTTVNGRNIGKATRVAGGVVLNF